MSEKAPLRVLVTGAAGQIAYSLLMPIADGLVFGRDQPIDLVLLDIEMMMGVLGGVVMELQDCAFPTLRSVETHSDPGKAFKDVDYALLVGAMPRKEGMERKDLLKANVRIFAQQGQCLDKLAKKTCKVVVVGNPANTNCYICRKYAPSIPSNNFSCLTRLDQNRAQAQIANACNQNNMSVKSTDVKNVIIWGNHSSTQYPDVSHAFIKDPSTGAKQAVNNDAWVKNEFVTTVQKRGAAVIAARKLSSAMSAAKAICDHVRTWHFGTPAGEFVSMGIPSDGSYGIPEGIVYSFPCKITDGKAEIVKDLSIDDHTREKMNATLAELDEEKNAAEEFTSGN